MNKPVLSGNKLVKTFVDGSYEVDVLKGLNFEVNAGETVAILGASGSGKSTLLHILGGLDEPTEGEVFWQDSNIHRLSEKEKCALRNQHLGFIYQFHHLLPEFTALENVSMPLLLADKTAEQAKDEAAKILDRVGLTNRVTHKVAQLSGGERQRVAIARAMVNSPQCILADEPTGNLDQKTAHAVLDVMLSLQDDYKTSFIVVTHDLGLADKLQRSYTLENGHLI